LGNKPYRIVTPGPNQTCKQHTGFDARIKHVENDTSDQWIKLTAQDDRINSIFMRFNFTMGGIIVMTLSVLLHTVVLLIKG